MYICIHIHTYIFVYVLYIYIYIAEEGRAAHDLAQVQGRAQAIQDDEGGAHLLCDMGIRLQFRQL